MFARQNNIKQVGCLITSIIIVKNSLFVHVTGNIMTFYSYYTRIGFMVNVWTICGSKRILTGKIRGLINYDSITRKQSEVSKVQKHQKAVGCLGMPTCKVMGNFWLWNVHASPRGIFPFCLKIMFVTQHWCTIQLHPILLTLRGGDGRTHILDPASLVLQYIVIV